MLEKSLFYQHSFPLNVIVVLSGYYQMQMPSGILVSGDNIEEIHVEWGERPTFLMTEVLHRRLLIKSLSTAVC